MKKSKKGTAAFILAAGFGSRLTSIGSKPLLPCFGRTFIELVVEKILNINLDPIILLTNIKFAPEIQKLKLPVKTVINHNPERGMLSSILIGMEELSSNCDGFFLCPVDFPLVKQKTYNQLLQTFENNKNRIIKPQFHNKSGHPIVFPKILFEELIAAPLDRGARFVTSKYSHQTNFINVNDPGILININSPQMYQKYCK